MEAFRVVNTTDLGAEMRRDRENRLTQPPPETGARYTAEYTEDDDGHSWDRTSRLHDNPSRR